MRTWHVTFPHIYVCLTPCLPAQVRAAIEAATTREAIEVIERHLKAGSLAFLGGDAAAVGGGEVVAPAGDGVTGGAGAAGAMDVSEESKGGTPAPAPAAAPPAAARVKLPAGESAADGDADEDMEMA